MPTKHKQTHNVTLVENQTNKFYHSNHRKNSQRRLDDSSWPKIAEDREKDSSVTLIREQLVTKKHHQGDQTLSDLVISETKSRKTAYKQACRYPLPYMPGTQKVKSLGSVKQPLHTASRIAPSVFVL